MKKMVSAERVSRSGSRLAGFFLPALLSMALIVGCAQGKQAVENGGSADAAGGGVRAASRDEKTATGPGKESRVSVAVTEPRNKTVERLLSLNGTIHSRNVLQVVAETQGKVMRVYAETGRNVAKGDILVQIDDEIKQASFATAQAAFDKSKADWIRAQELYTQKVIADSELAAVKLGYASAEAQLKISRRDLDNARVRSAISGVVSATFVTEGALLSPGTPVAQVVDTMNLKLSVNVGERDIMKIAKGMTVKIETDTYPGSTFSGKVSAISPKGDAAMSFPVEIQIDRDAKRPLYDGMSAEVSVNLGKRSILALPRSSLVSSYQKPQVYVITDGVAHLTDIIVGSEYGTDFELVKGLNLDDKVVTSGQNNLSEGQAVDIVGDTK